MVKKFDEDKLELIIFKAIVGQMSFRNGQAIVTALGSVVTALIVWVSKKGVNYLDKKTRVLDKANEMQKKEAIKNKVIDVVTLVARSTTQTYVDEVKKKSADGKLTSEEAGEAFRRTFNLHAPFDVF